jgi:hypothetical protein
MQRKNCWLTAYLVVFFAGGRPSCDSSKCEFILTIPERISQFMQHTFKMNLEFLLYFEISVNTEPNFVTTDRKISFFDNVFFNEQNFLLWWNRFLVTLAQLHKAANFTTQVVDMRCHEITCLHLLSYWLKVGHFLPFLVPFTGHCSDKNDNFKNWFWHICSLYRVL